MTTVQIDWAAQDKYPEDTCTCRCGTVYRTHARMIMVPTPNIVARKPCPACGGIALTRASSDPEAMTIDATQRRSPE